MEKKKRFIQQFKELLSQFGDIEWDRAILKELANFAPLFGKGLLLPSSPLHRSDLSEDPFEQFAKWYAEAEQAPIAHPEAMALATSTPDGQPSVRMVLCKEFSKEKGFVFYTNYESDKAKILDNNPRAELLFYWMPLQRQVRIYGKVEKISREESEHYFKTRPRESQLSAWASPQSKEVPSREYLEEKRRQIAEEFRGKEVPCPPFWGGYRVLPEKFEFWQGREYRFHDRFRYSKRKGDGEGWEISRIAP